MFKVYMDSVSISDEGFEEALKKELQSADCVVAFWSKAAAESSWAQWGVRAAIRAWSYGRLLLASLDDTPLPVGLRDISPIMIGGGSESAVNELIERAKAIGAAHSGIARPASEEKITWLASAGGTISLLTARVGNRVFWALRPPENFLVYVAVGILSVSAIVAIMTDRSGQAPGPALVEVVRLSVIAAWLVGILVGVGVAWAWGVRKRRAAKSLPIANLSPAVAPKDVSQVFVSYSHQDVGTVDGLVKQFQAMGYTVWIDREVAGTRRYAGQIVGAIRTSKLVALMCSRSAFASDHVIREIYIAGDYKKPFIAFLLDLTDFPDEVQYFLSGFPRIPIASVDSHQLRSQIARIVTA
jgi:hypothetical protein